MYRTKHMQKKRQKSIKTTKRYVYPRIQPQGLAKLSLKNPTLIIVLVGLIFLGWLIFRVFAASPGPQSLPLGANSNCGATVQNYTYQVPFGESPWNVAACGLPVFANDQSVAREFGRRLYGYATAWNADSQYWQDRISSQKGKFMTQFGFAGDQNDYSTPIYYATAATPRKKIKVCNAESCLPSNLDRANCWNVEDLTCMVPEATIPYDPSWRPSGDTDENLANNAFDREMVIVDQVNNAVYSLWGLDRGNLSCIGGRSILYALSGKDPDSRLCVASASVTRDSTGTIGNYYTYSQGITNERGLGIQNAAMIVTPEEVAAGEIRHALTMELFNSMYGPECASSDLPAAPDAGLLRKNCGYAVAPATRVEWQQARDISRLEQCADQANKLADYSTKQTFRKLFTPDKTIPEGMRFKITNTNEEIDAWIRSRPDLAADSLKARTARIFAVALRDYGFIPGDTTCNGAGFTIAGAANPRARQQWASLGIKDATSQNLLEGLFSDQNIIALNPPTNTCTDGRNTQFYCPWIKSTYPVVSGSASPSASGPPSTTSSTSVTTSPASPPPLPVACDPAAKNVVCPTPSQSPALPVQPKSVGAILEPGLSPVRWNVRLNWQASPSPSQKYVIARNGLEIGTATTPTYLDSSFALPGTFGPHTTYLTYSITAVSAAGQSSPPAIYGVTLQCFWIACSL